MILVRLRSPGSLASVPSHGVRTRTGACARSPTTGATGCTRTRTRRGHAHARRATPPPPPPPPQTVSRAASVCVCRPRRSRLPPPPSSSKCARASFSHRSSNRFHVALAILFFYPSAPVSPAPRLAVSPYVSLASDTDSSRFPEPTGTRGTQPIITRQPLSSLSVNRVARASSASTDDYRLRHRVCVTSSRPPSISSYRVACALVLFIFFSIFYLVNSSLVNATVSTGQ